MQVLTTDFIEIKWTNIKHICFLRADVNSSDTPEKTTNAEWKPRNFKPIFKSALETIADSQSLLIYLYFRACLLSCKPVDQMSGSQ